MIKSRAKSGRRVVYTLPEDTPFPEATDEPRQCGWISALQSVHRPGDVV